MSEQTIIAQLAGVTGQMQASGIRRMLVLAGQASWSDSLAVKLRLALPGDWLWVGDNAPWAAHSPTAGLRNLLGQEFQHAVFDARSGLDASALAALSGTLKAGSWLVLLVPDWRAWPEGVDADSTRWSDVGQPIATPHFISYLQTCLLADPDPVLWHQHQPPTLTSLPDYPPWQAADGRPEKEQAALLDNLQQMTSGVAVVTAGRGRGKSALAGMLIASTAGQCLVTAPTKAATQVVAHYAADRFHFMAPDALLAHLTERPIDWLIIDEAAAIPAPVLRQLIDHFPRILLTTTVQGYEGTGRGFLLKFCASLPALHAYSLNTPIRWALNDPLERLMAGIMLFDDADLSPIRGEALTIQAISQQQWPQQSAAFIAMYRLLAAAHYRTSPLDWRRMLDAPGQRFIAAFSAGRCAAALWLVEEGGLSRRLSYQVWAGFRRPRGNLVAQSLAAHGASPQAATLRGLRISRIAVHPSLQRQQIGYRLVMQALAIAKGQYDYLSVSFGYTEALWQFWQACGFTLVRIGTQRETSSGCYNAMAILPLSVQGERLRADEQRRFIYELPWQRPWRDKDFSFTPALERLSPDTPLSDADCFGIAGFAFAHRPLETCLGGLNRLLLACDLPLPLLRKRLVEQASIESLCQAFHLSGRKALLAALRQESAAALAQIAPNQAERYRQFITRLG